MTFFGSIKTRIVAFHFIAVLAVCVLLPLVLYWRVEATARALHEHALREQAEQIGHYLHRGPDAAWMLDLPDNLRLLYAAGYERYGFAIITKSGQVLFSSREGPQPLFPSDPRQESPLYFERNVGPARFFGASVPATVGDELVWIQITQDQAHRDVLIDDIVAEFLPHIAWVIIPMLLVLVAIDLMIFDRALRPLVEASQLAQHISPARTDIRIPDAGIPSEILPLTRAVNQALDRLQCGFITQREFLADAAHELRTPLAILRAEVETQDDSDATTTLLGDIERKTRIVSQLIEIAELDTLIVQHDDNADIHEICTEVAATMAPFAIAQGKDLALSGSATPVWITGKSTALFQAIRNLVENAITHTSPGTTVDINVTPDGTVNVSDEGRGIPLEHRELIFQRFWHGDRPRAGGAGLGLAIVSRVITAHGGEISVRDNSVGGTVFSITLPRSAIFNHDRLIEDLKT
jgi:signal transduction histidine kinase